MKIKFIAVCCVIVAWLLVAPQSWAVTPPAPFLTAYSYNAGGVLTGKIEPAPSGSINFLATRYSYDPNGRLSQIEVGVLSSWPTNLSPASSWTNFTPSKSTTISYDADGRKVLEVVAGNDGGQTNATQYSYDAENRLICTTVRMNPAAFGSMPADACTLTSGSPGPNWPDRITKNTYDALNRVTLIQRAFGTSLVENYATYTYTADSQRQSVTDANGNYSYFAYKDGFDRLTDWYFPSPTAAGSYNASDYEEYSYDPNGNKRTLRKRDTQMISWNYDALNRVTQKVEPVASNSVNYGYDLRGLQLYALFNSTGLGIRNGYDGFGRRTSTTNTMGTTSLTVGRQYDLDGDLTRVTHPDTNYFQYTNDGDDRFTGVLENNSTSIVSQNYYPNGLRSRQTRGAVLTSYSYQPNTLLQSVAETLASTASITTSFTFNASNQLLTRLQSNSAYIYTGYVDGTQSYTVNGLNEYTSVGGGAVTYDPNGNLWSDGQNNNYTYDADNKLVSASGAHSATLTYDPLGRLFRVVSGGSTTQFLYDGDALVAEYNGSTGALLRRYVQGAGEDTPLIWYEGATLSSTTRRSLQANHQGSIVSVADASGNSLNINTYNEYGVPGANNAGRFQYTGQAMIAELNLYYYKARFYSATFGRFLQTDPIGYQDDVDLYTYAGNDPLDRTDPSGRFGSFLVCNGGQGCVDGNAKGMGRQNSDEDDDSAQSQNSLFQSNNALDWNFFTTKGGLPAESALQGIDYFVTQLVVNFFNPQPSYINGIPVNTGIAPVPLGVRGGGTLVRFGRQAETTESLGSQAARAEANGFPHGVSTRLRSSVSKSDLANHRCAPKCDVEEVFPVQQTGTDLRHHTVILPKPVTQSVVDQFNNIFVP